MMINSNLSALHRRPLGPAPTGKMWDPMEGMWVSNQEEAEERKNNKHIKKKKKKQLNQNSVSNQSSNTDTLQEPQEAQVPPKKRQRHIPTEDSAVDGGPPSAATTATLESDSEQYLQQEQQLQQPYAVSQRSHGSDGAVVVAVDSRYHEQVSNMAVERGSYYTVATDEAYPDRREEHPNNAPRVLAHPKQGRFNATTVQPQNIALSSGEEGRAAATGPQSPPPPPRSRFERFTRWAESNENSHDKEYDSHHRVDESPGDGDEDVVARVSSSVADRLGIMRGCLARGYVALSQFEIEAREDGRIRADGCILPKHANQLKRNPNDFSFLPPDHGESKQEEGSDSAAEVTRRTTSRHPPSGYEWDGQRGLWMPQSVFVECGACVACALEWDCGTCLTCHNNLRGGRNHPCRLRVCVTPKRLQEVQRPILG